MNDFGWPQWTVLITWCVSFVFQSVKVIRDPQRSSGVVAAIIIAYAAYIAFFAYVLHAGGFW